MNKLFQENKYYLGLFRVGEGRSLDALGTHKWLFGYITNRSNITFAR